MTVLANAGLAIGRLLRKVLLGVVLVGLFLAVLVGAWAWWASIGVFSTSRFDRADWLAPVYQDRESTCYRGSMARDIKNRLLAPGMTKEEVVSLLGQPDDPVRPQELEYTLGMCSGIRIDYDGLIIRFSPDGRLLNAYIVQH